MQLYVVRHGQTDWNAQNRVCGHTDLPLNAQGILQAQAQAQNFLEKGVCPAYILSSPLLRARQTAELLARTLGASVAVDARLIEVDYGLYDGADRGDAGFQHCKAQFAVRFPQGESMLQAAHRVYSLMEELSAAMPPAVVLVTHGGICRLIETYFHDLPNAAFPEWRMSNAQATKYTIEKTQGDQ